MNVNDANSLYYNQGATGNTGQSEDAAQLSSDFDDFLTLLTTQLQNQDPLSPTDTTEFTNQLVAFTEVEQSIATNDNLASLIELQTISQQNNEATILISYLGHQIGANTSVGALKDGEANWELDFGSNADTVTYEVYNEKGAKVYSETTDGTVSAGDQTYTWEGQMSSGAAAAEGTYYLVVKAGTEGGSQVDVKYNFKGLADRVETQNGVPVLMVDGLPVGLAEINSVELDQTGNESA